jgi:hypothetical protein
MMIAAFVLLPRLLAADAEPKDAVQLNTPRVQYRPNEASATRSPWIDANGWRILRAPDRTFVYHVEGDAAALAAAEGFAYGAHALIGADAAGTEAFGRMLEFLHRIPDAELIPVADIGVVDDGKDPTGELMNLLARQNLLYKVERAPDPKLRVNVQPGVKAGNPNLLAHQIRAQLSDENRSLRIYGGEVVIARLMANSTQARVYLLNYSNRPVRGLRVRVRGVFAKGEPRVFGVSAAHLEDWTPERDATEFTIPEMNAFAVIDLFR